PGQSIKKAIGLGMAKVNVNTDLRVAYTETLRDVLKSGEIVPYKYMPRVIAKVQKIVEDKITLFQSKNKI
ncbi:MAG: class II fructose-bisphosphate aldolase, partial [Candidatus Paceibacterota bacterium]